MALTKPGGISGNQYVAATKGQPLQQWMQFPKGRPGELNFPSGSHGHTLPNFIQLSLYKIQVFGGRAGQAHQGAPHLGVVILFQLGHQVLA